MRNVLLTAALAIAALPAFALAPSGGEPNNTGCNGAGNSNSPCQPSNTNENANGQSQAQGQGQAQGQVATGGNGTGVGIGIGKGGEGGSANASGGSATSGSSSGSISGSHSGLSDSGNSSSVAKGGSVGDTSSNASTGPVDASSGSVASADGSGNSSTHVNASNNSRYSSQALFLPTLSGAAPTFVPGSSATVVAGQCGPLMATESEEVNGTYLGLIRKHSIYLGRTDRIVPYEGGEYVSRSYPDGSTRLFGHRAVRTTAVLNVAGSRQVSLGGGETGGNWGQGGAGGGSSMQRLVVQIDLEPCEAFHSVPVPPVVAVQVTPTPAKPKRRVVRRPDEVCRPAPAIPATTCPVK